LGGFFGDRELQMNLIEQCLREAIDEAEGGNADFFVTLEAAGDETRWVQLTWDRLNFAYPLKGSPLKALKERGVALPRFVELSEWESGQFATFEHGAEPVAGLVSFIESYLTCVLSIELHPDAMIALREGP
jgi:hypothetical protein